MRAARTTAWRVRLAALACSLAWGTPASAGGEPAAGKKLYDVICVTCHGAAGQGDGPMSAALAAPPRDFSKGEFKFDADRNGTPGEDTDLKLVIKNGAEAYGGSPDMTAWRKLRDRDTDDLVAYIRSLRK